MRGHIDRLIPLIFAVRKMTNDQIAQEGRRAGSFLQAVTLKYIKAYKPLMKEVADFLAITPPSATSLVDTLVNAGLVTRSRPDTDRRVVRLEITEAGEVCLSGMMGALETRLRKSLEVLTEEERWQLEGILSKILSVGN